MTDFQFHFFTFQLTKLFEQCTAWFTDMMFSCFSAFLFYMSCITIYFFVKYLVRPFVGSSMGSGRSDMAKKPKAEK